ncbi:MAG: hypothetical protein IKF90_13240, partial [Parasporobacterium sp.]|nr:hypothetical protein [Parasporobacterium sp.]
TYRQAGIFHLNALFCISVETLLQFHSSPEGVSHFFADGKILDLLFIINDWFQLTQSSHNFNCR